jgi:hypothetical protein
MLAIIPDLLRLDLAQHIVVLGRGRPAAYNRQPLAPLPRSVSRFYQVAVQEMRCGTVCLSEFVAADYSEQRNQHSRKNRIIVNRENDADVTPYTQRVQRGVQAIFKLDSKRPLQFSEQSAPVVTNCS